MDYKGPIGLQRWYLHMQICPYSRYLEVHMIRSTGMTELRKVLNKTMRTHGVPTEVWSGGGLSHKNGCIW